MPPRRKLSDFHRARAIAWLQAGMSMRQVAQRLPVSHSVIVRLIQRFATTGLIQEQQRSGRPRVTTARQDRFIQFHALRERTSTANDIRRHLQASSNTVVSDQTEKQITRKKHASTKASHPTSTGRTTSKCSHCLVQSTFEMDTSTVGSSAIQ